MILYTHIKFDLTLIRNNRWLEDQKVGYTLEHTFFMEKGLLQAIQKWYRPVYKWPMFT